MNQIEPFAPTCRWMLRCGILALGAAWVSLRFSAVITGILLAGLALSAVWFRRERSVLPLLAVAALFLLVGSGYRYMYTILPEPLDEESDTLTGQILEQQSDHWYTLKVTDSALLRTGTRVLLYCPDAAAPEVYDVVTAPVTYHTLGNEDNRYRADRILLKAMPVGYGEEALTVLESGTGVRHTVSHLRETLSDRLRRWLPGQEGAVLTAMCLGDKQYLSEEVQQAFRSCGLPHVLVVSGLHLSVIIGTVYGLGQLLRLSRRWTVVLTAVVMLGYSGLVGFSPSVCRAGIMALMVLAGRLVRRPADGLNSMGLALCLILLENPYGMYDVGLQLSFSAVAGVLALTPRMMEMTAPLAEKLPWCRPILAGLCTTGGASLMLSPFLASYFYELSWISLLANLIVVPLAGVLLLLGCLALILLSCPPLAWCGRGLTFAAGWLTRGLLWLCELGDRWTKPLSVAEGSPRFWLIVVACLLLAILQYRRWYKAAGRVLVLLAAAFLLVYPGEVLLQAGRYEVSVESSGGTSAVVMIRHGKQCFMLIQDAEGCDTAAQLWKHAGEPDEVVLAVGGGDTAHAADVTELRQTIGATMLLATEEAAWTVGLPIEIRKIAVNHPVDVGAEITLTWLADGWCRVRMGDTCLLILPTGEDFSPRKILKESVDGLVFCGEIVYNDCWIQVPESIWICTPAQKRLAASLPVTPKVTVSDSTVVLSTQGRGDWSYR